MSLEPITVDIQRDVITADAFGGETAVSSTVYSGLSVTIGYPSKNAVQRFEPQPGAQTKSDRVVFLDDWDGTVALLVNDRVVPNPAIATLPASFNVIAVRPYDGQVQWDVEDVA